MATRRIAFLTAYVRMAMREPELAQLQHALRGGGRTTVLAAARLRRHSYASVGIFLENKPQLHPALGAVWQEQGQLNFQVLAYSSRQICLRMAKTVAFKSFAPRPTANNFLNRCIQAFHEIYECNISSDAINSLCVVCLFKPPLELPKRVSVQRLEQPS